MSSSLMVYSGFMLFFFFFSWYFELVFASYTQGFFGHTEVFSTSILLTSKVRSIVLDNITYYNT